MKVMQVDFEYDYGDKRRGLNQIGWYGVKAAFENLGHELLYFAYDSYLDRPQDLARDLLTAVKDKKPDLILISLFRDQFSFELLSQLKDHTRTVCWFGDDTWRFADFSSKYAAYFTDIITTDPLAVAKYHQLGHRRVHLSQWAAMDVPGLSVPEKPVYEREISFVGGANATRRWMVQHLRKKGFKIDCFGHGWEGGLLSTEGMIKMFQTSKINLNLSNSLSYDIRFLTSGPRAWKAFLRSSKTGCQIKARNFEIPFWGGFQLTDYAPFLERYLRIGEEVACFPDIDEAALLLRYYLDNEELREKVRRAGMARARNEHLYFHRIRAYLADDFKYNA